MNFFPVEPETGEIVEVSWGDRWQVYKRLQELEISCWCSINQPLRVQINNAKDVVQLSSVIRQFSAPRQELVSSLKRCWKRTAPQFFD